MFKRKWNSFCLHVMGSLWMKLAEDLSPTVSLGQEAYNVPWALS